jgi:hypothetical protein
LAATFGRFAVRPRRCASNLHHPLLCLSLPQDYLAGREGAGHSISFPARLETIARAKAIDCDTMEIWFADEARIGQKNKITRRWAKRRHPPIAPRDQRTASTYIFGARLIVPVNSSCATNGSQTTSSNPTTISSTIAARLGMLIDQPWRIMSIVCANGARVLINGTRY